MKTAALYSDKLGLLDPHDVTWDRPAGPGVLDEVLLLEQHGLLERVNPRLWPPRQPSPYLAMACQRGADLGLREFGGQVFWLHG